MTIFGNIMSKIFGHAKAQTAPSDSQRPSGAATGSSKALRAIST